MSAEGVVVLDPGPYGARAGLRPGDILRAINGVPVEATGDIDPVLRRAAPRIQIEAQRGSRNVFLRFRV